MKKLFFSGIITSIFLILIVFSAYTGFLEFRVNPEYLAEPNINNSKFTISRELANELNENYRNSDKEFSVCLDTERKAFYSEDGANLKMTYSLNSFEGDIKYSGNDYSINGYCEEGIIHSHPKGSCYFSLADISAFKSRIPKGETFSLVMCAEDEFVYITRNNFLENKVIIES